jgi:hypothetical protein
MPANQSKRIPEYVPTDAQIAAAEDRDVIYMGVPYAQSKFIDGVWYFRTPDGGYKRFTFQAQVKETPADIGM